MSQPYDWNSPRLFEKRCYCGSIATKGPRGNRRCDRCAAIESHMTDYHPQDRAKPDRPKEELQPS